MRMRWPLAIAAWLAAAALATAVSIGAVGMLSRGLFGPSDAPLSEADVEAQSAPLPSTASPRSTAGPSSAAGSSSGSSSASSSAQPVPAVNSRALSTGGGSIVASCAGGQVYLESWIPRSGFEADHVQRGPSGTASLRFKARSGGGQVRAQVTCQDGEPALTVLRGDD